MKQITVAVDSFKGSLSSFEVASAAERGIHATLPDCHVQKIAIADGDESLDRTLATVGYGYFLHMAVG